MSTDYSDSIAKTYAKGAKEYADYFFDPHIFLEPERTEFLSKLPQNGTILDCGCGPGQDTEYFSNLDYQVTAVDLTDEFIQIAKQRAPKARFIQADMKQMQFDDATFDGIWLSFSLLHIHKDDIPQLLKNFYRFLKPNGLLMVALHTNEETNWVQVPIAGMEKDCHVQEWNKQEFEKALVDAGFSIFHSRSFTRINGRYPLLGIVAKKT